MSGKLYDGPRNSQLAFRHSILEHFFPLTFITRTCTVFILVALPDSFHTEANVFVTAISCTSVYGLENIMCKVKIN